MEPQLFLNHPFEQVAIANLGPFQIAVPTTVRLIKRHFFSSWIPVPERTYATHGWLIYDQKLVAHIKALQIKPINMVTTSPKPIKRLTASVPVSFQVETVWPLPQSVLDCAIFACKVPDEVFAHQAVLREVVPRFVRLYPFSGSLSLKDQVKQLLADEALFIARNYEQLKQVPFYQKHFGLE